MDLGTKATRRALMGGVLSLVSYGLIVFALSIEQAGPITALRETSVVFAALIGSIFPNEELTLRRVISGLIVVAGTFFLSV